MNIKGQRKAIYDRNNCFGNLEHYSNKKWEDRRINILFIIEMCHSSDLGSAFK